ncbi:hypothetical protein CR513_46396, partial [Mucuna pruriens]
MFSVVDRELALSELFVCVSRSVSLRPDHFFASLTFRLSSLSIVLFFIFVLLSRLFLSTFPGVFEWRGEELWPLFVFLFFCVFMRVCVLAWVPGLTLALGFVGNLSNGSAKPSSSGGSAAQGSESQCSASPAVEEGFPFEVVYREAGVMPARGTPSWLDHGVVTPRSAYTSAEKLVGMANAICRQGPWSVTFSPCRPRECMCESPADGVEHYFYFYETLFSKLSIILPFTAFEQLVLCTLNIAPAQIHPNSWAFVRAFELLSEDLSWEPSLGVFYWFFSIHQTEKVGWASLSSCHGRQLMKPFRENYKQFKENFFWVLEGEAGPSVLFDAFGNSFFPLYWSDRLALSIMIDRDDLED